MIFSVRADRELGANIANWGILGYLQKMLLAWLSKLTMTNQDNLAKVVCPKALAIMAYKRMQQVWKILPVMWIEIIGRFTQTLLIV
jgi:hypothetical protein